SSEETSRTKLWPRSSDSADTSLSLRGTRVAYAKRLIVALRTQPPSRSGKGDTSVPPPQKLIRRGARLLMHSTMADSGCKGQEAFGRTKIVKWLPTARAANPLAGG